MALAVPAPSGPADVNPYNPANTNPIDRPGAVQQYALDPSTLDQWRSNMVTGEVKETRIDDRPIEFPRVDERRVGLAHRYGYGAAEDDGWILAFAAGLPRQLDRRSERSPLTH